jgi:hypothetical protein
MGHRVVPSALGRAPNRERARLIAGEKRCRRIVAAGYIFRNDAWQAPASAPPASTAETDRMHALLVLWADQLMDTEGSPEAGELEAIAEALEAYESVRWPEGKVPGGKG